MVRTGLSRSARRLGALLVFALLAGMLPAMASAQDDALQRAIQVQERIAPHLLATPGIVGVGVAVTAGAQARIRVYTVASNTAGVPAKLELHDDRNGEQQRFPPRQPRQAARVRDVHVSRLQRGHLELLEHGHRRGALIRFRDPGAHPGARRTLNLVRRSQSRMARSDPGQSIVREPEQRDHGLLKGRGARVQDRDPELPGVDRVGEQPIEFGVVRLEG